MAELHDIYQKAIDGGMLNKSVSEERFGKILQDDKEREDYYNYVKKKAPNFYSSDYAVFSKNAAALFKKPVEQVTQVANGSAQYTPQAGEQVSAQGTPTPPKQSFFQRLLSGITSTPESQISEAMMQQGAEKQRKESEAAMQSRYDNYQQSQQQSRRAEQPQEARPVQNNADFISRVGLTPSGNTETPTTSQLAKLRNEYASQVYDRRYLNKDGKPKDSFAKDLFENWQAGVGSLALTPYKALETLENFSLDIDNAVRGTNFQHGQGTVTRFANDVLGGNYLRSRVEHFQKESDRYQDKKGIIESGLEGDLGTATGKAVLGTIQSAPNLAVSIYSGKKGYEMLGGSFLGATAALQKYDEIKDREDIGAKEKALSMFGAFVSECVPEIIGAKRYGRMFNKQTVGTLRREVQQEVMKGWEKFLQTDFMKRMGKGWDWFMKWFGEGATESLTDVMNLGIDLALGIKDDIKQSDILGIGDSFIIGQLSDAIPSGVHVYQRNDYRNKVKQEIEGTPDLEHVAWQQNMKPDQLADIAAKVAYGDNLSNKEAEVFEAYKDAIGKRTNIRYGINNLIYESGIEEDPNKQAIFINAVEHSGKTQQEAYNILAKDYSDRTEEEKQYLESLPALMQEQQRVSQAIDNGTPIQIGTSPLFGNMYQWMRGKNKEAAVFLQEQGSGYLKGVFHRDGLGEVDAIWGNDKAGVNKIIEKHINKLHDFASIDEAMSIIDQVIEHGVVNKKRSNEKDIVLELSPFRVVLTQSPEGTWVLSAYDYVRGEDEKNGENPSASQITASQTSEDGGARAVAPESSSISEDKGTTNISNTQVFDQENAIREQISAQIAKISNNNGNIYRIQDPANPDARGYIIKGNVIVDESNPNALRITNDDLVTVKFDDGRVEQGRARDFDLIERPAESGDVVNTIIAQRVQQAHLKEMSAQTFQAGQEVTKTGSDGQEYNSKVVSVTDEGVEVEIENPLTGEPDTTIIPHDIALQALRPKNADSAGKESADELSSAEANVVQFTNGKEYLRAIDNGDGTYTIINKNGEPETGPQPLSEFNRLGYNKVGQKPTPSQKQSAPDMNTMSAEEYANALVTRYNGNKDRAKTILQAQLKKAQQDMQSAGENPLQEPEDPNDIAAWDAYYAEQDARSKIGQALVDKLQAALRAVDNVLSPEEQAEAERKAAEAKRLAAEKAHQERMKMLRGLADKYEKKFGMKIVLFENENDIPASQTAGRAKYKEVGDGLDAWVDLKKKTVFMNANVYNDEQRFREKIFHEIVAHVGLRNLLGEDFDRLLDAVWESMTPEQRAERIQYTKDSVGTDVFDQMSEQEKQHYAADEYLAFLSEKYTSLDDADQSAEANEIRSAWQKICDMVRELLGKIFEGEITITDKEIAQLLNASYAKLRQEAEARTDDTNNEKMRQDLSGILKKFDKGEPSPGDANLPYDTEDLRDEVMALLQKYNVPSLQAAVDAVEARLEREAKAGIMSAPEVEDDEEELLRIMRDITGVQPPKAEELDDETKTQRGVFKITLSGVDSFLERIYRHNRGVPVTDEAINATYEPEIGTYLRKAVPFVDEEQLKAAIFAAKARLEKIKGKSDKRSNIQRQVFKNIVRDLEDPQAYERSQENKPLTVEEQLAQAESNPPAVDDSTGNIKEGEGDTNAPEDGAFSPVTQKYIDDLNRLNDELVAVQSDADKYEAKYKEYDNYIRSLSDEDLVKIEDELDKYTAKHPDDNLMKSYRSTVLQEQARRTDVASTEKAIAEQAKPQSEELQKIMKLHNESRLILMKKDYGWEEDYNEKQLLLRNYLDTLTYDQLKAAMEEALALYGNWGAPNVLVDTYKVAMNNVEHAEAFEYKLKTQGVTPKDVSKPKINIKQWVAPKNDVRPVLSGVYHDPSGVGVATDAHIMLVMDSMFDKDKEGKIIAPDGNEVKVFDKDGTEVKLKYPNWKGIIDGLHPKNEVRVDWNALRRFIAGTKDAMASMKKEDKDNARITLRMPNGDLCCFDLKRFSAFADAAASFGADVLQYEDSRHAFFVKSGDNVALIMPISDPVLLPDNAFAYDLKAQENQQPEKKPVTKMDVVKAAQEEKKRPTHRASAAAEPTQHIEDVGEKIEGARKDMRAKIAKTLADVTEQALIENPLGKVYKKPDLKKAVEEGALREKDARFYEALFALIDPIKPKIKQRDTRMKRWNSDYETPVEKWAKATHGVIETLRQFVELDEDGRDRFMEAAMRDHFPTREQELAKIEERKVWNKDRDIEWGDKTSPNPVWIMNEVLKKMDYTAGDKVDMPFTVITASTSGTSYSINTPKDERLYGVHYDTLEDAIDGMVYFAKLKRGDADLAHPINMFYSKPTKSELGETGRYKVAYGFGGGLYSYKTREFDNKEDADKFAATKRGAIVQPIKEVVRRYGYVTMYRNPLTGEDIQVSDQEFDTREDAAAYIGDEYDAVNDALNKQLEDIREKSGEKKQLTPDEMVYVAFIYANGVRKYGVYIDKKYANNGGQPYLIAEFDKKDDAIAFRDANKQKVYDAYMKLREEGKKVVYFDTGENSRLGEDYRGGRDVTAEEFMNEFGFRGVQFGNWTNQDDRQMAVNQAYDAFKDLAKLIGKSPKAISLNGELGIAFGARGGGSALAHYEPNEVVINLTKTKGAGSLAHEWWHALDNYLARSKGKPSSFVTANELIPIREELRQAFHAMLAEVKKSDYAKRSQSKGTYWGDIIEVTARLFAEWADQELKKNGELNTFLSRGANTDQWQSINYEMYKYLEGLAGREPMSFEEYKEKPESLQGNPYPTPKEVEEFGDLLRNVFNTMQERIDEESGKTVLFSMTKPKAEQPRELSLFDDDESVRFSTTYKPSEDNSLTPAAAREMQDIKERSQADGTFMQAPNGKPTNLNERQWLQVRTRAFKRWFGDWESGKQKAARIEKLRKSEPILLSGKEFELSEDLKQAKKNAFEYGKTLQGYYINADTGHRIQLQRGRHNGGVNEVLQHNYKDIAHLQSVAAIPQIIEKSIFIANEPNSDREKNPTVASYDHYVCGLKIGNVEYTVHALVAVDSHGDRYYDHNLVQIEKEKLLEEIQQATSNRDFGTTPDTKSTISNSDRKGTKLFSILQENSQKNADFSQILDENDEPAVLFHRTWGDFTEFDKSKIGSSTDVGAFGEGFYFSPSDKILYGKNRMDCFLNVRNPLYLNDERASKEKAKHMVGGEFTKESASKMTEDLTSRGYDGVVYNNGYYQEVCVFEPNQIKSATDNNGSFSKDNNDIRYSVTPKASPFETKLERAKRLSADLKSQNPKDTSLDDAIRFSVRVNHNSPYLLKKEDGSFVDPETGERLGFDHRFMGAGEGAQVHGWGSYFSVKDLRTYADPRNTRYVYKGKTWQELWDEHENPEYDAAATVIEDMEYGNSAEDALKNAIESTEVSISFYHKDDVERGTNYAKGFERRLKALQKLDASDFTRNTNRNHHYEVLIPDNTGANYLEERKRVSAEGKKRIADAVRNTERQIPYATIWTVPKDIRRRVAEEVRKMTEEQLDRAHHGRLWMPGGVGSVANSVEREQRSIKEIKHYLADAFNATEADRIAQDANLPDDRELLASLIEANNSTSSNIRYLLAESYRSEETASRILREAGFVGTHYVGSVDGECYVIFDDKDAMIVDHTRFSVTKKGNEKDSLIDQYQPLVDAAKTNELKAAVIESYISDFGNNVLPAKAVFSDAAAVDMLKQAEFTDEQAAASLKEAKKTNFSGMYLPNGTMMLWGERVTDLKHARRVYVHERQHLFNKTEESRILVPSVILASNPRELAQFLRNITGKTYYDKYLKLAGWGFSRLADEVVAYGLEMCYETPADMDVKTYLRERGIANEAIIDIIYEEYQRQRRWNPDLVRLAGGREVSASGSDTVGRGGQSAGRSDSGLSRRADVAADADNAREAGYTPRELAQLRDEAIAESNIAILNNPFKDMTIMLTPEVTEEDVVDIQVEDEDDTEEGSIRFSIVTNPSTLSELNAGETVKVYRAMQLRDGKLYPPMAGKVEGRWQEPIRLGEWEQAVERPELANDKNKFKLDKGNGKTLSVAYNPYIHTSRSPLNDQFSSAWSRPELVTVEVEVPVSELTSGYKAEKAKDAVGELDWPSGPVSKVLAKNGNPRKVILSRYDKPIRIVPVDEVAARIADVLKDTNIKVPFNTVTPELREALVQKGVAIGAPQSGNAGESSMPDYEKWKKAEGDRIRFSEIMKNYPKLRSDMVTKLLVENAKNNYVAMQAALKKVSLDIRGIQSAMRMQAGYDRQVVGALLNLYQTLSQETSAWSGGYMPFTTAQIFNQIAKAVGKKDITEEVNKILDYVVAAQLKVARNQWDKLRDTPIDKINISGVVTQGKVAIEGQYALKALNETLDEIKGFSLQQLLGNPEAGTDGVIDKLMDMEDKATDESLKLKYKGQWIGYTIAAQYLGRIEHIKEEKEELNQDLQQAYANTNLKSDAQQQLIQNIQEAMRANRMAEAEAYIQSARDLEEYITSQGTKAKGFIKILDDRKQRIRKEAAEDLAGVDANILGLNRGKKRLLQDFADWQFATSRDMQSILRFIGRNTPNGKGYLYNHYFLDYQRAADKERLGLEANTDALSAKVQEIFGDKFKTFEDVSKFCAKEDNRLHLMLYNVFDGIRNADIPISVDNALYMYAVSKMEDGMMKLNAMNITKQDIVNLTAQINPKLIQLVDWVQSELFVKLRERYNKTHEVLYGAPMDAIENYFHLRIARGALPKDVDVADDENAASRLLPGTSTGPIKRRTKNTKPLDILRAGFLTETILHITQMEKWNAFAQWTRDVNILLSDQIFRERLRSIESYVYAKDGDLYKTLKEAMQLANGTYKANKESGAAFLLNVSKGSTSAKINFRLWTAVKQKASHVVVVNYLTNKEAWKEYSKLMLNPKNALNDARQWALDTLPNFRKRVAKRDLGDMRLMRRPSDWEWQRNILEAAGKYGMWSNMYFDTVTCAHVARIAYVSTKADLLKKNYSPEDAEERALLEAEIAFNTSQQSSENGYMAPVQADRTKNTVAHILFRTASMQYTREWLYYGHNIIKKMQPGAKEHMIEFETRRYIIAEGFNAEQARKNAESDYQRSWVKDIVGFILYGWVTNFVWRIYGALPYLVVGDDDDKKKELLKKAVTWGFYASPIAGLLYGGALESALDSRNVAELLDDDMPISGDLQKAARLIKTGQTTAVVSAALSVLIQSTIGFDVAQIVENVTDAVLVIKSKQDIDNAKKAWLVTQSLLQVPKSQYEQMLIDNVIDNRLEYRDALKDYQFYYSVHTAPLAWFMRGKEAQEKADKAAKTRFDKLLNERRELRNEHRH